MIQKLITEKSAGTMLIILFLMIITFHVIVLIGLIPMDMIWGGRLKTQQELYVFESVSVLLNALMLWATIIRIRYIQPRQPSTFTRVVFWLMFILFFLNTIGNMMALNNLESYIFTPITLLLALFSLRLALKPRSAF